MDLPATLVKLDDKSELPFANKLDVGHLQIFDVRMDTSKLWFATIGNTKKFLKLELAGGMSTLNTFLQKRYQPIMNPQNAGRLVIFIKTLWFQQKPVVAKDSKDKIVHDNTWHDPVQTTALFDVYLQTENYYQAVARIDTSFTIKNKNKVPGAIADLFDYTVEKANGQTAEAYKRRQISVAEVAAAYDSRREKTNANLPIPKGVYLSFQDFLDRKPVHQDCTIEFDAKSDQVYIHQNGQPQMIEKYWGVSNGKDMFIHLAFNLYAIYPQQNTFELMGSNDTYHINRRYSTSIRGAMITTTTDQMILKISPLQLNMETGKPY